MTVALTDLVQKLNQDFDAKIICDLADISSSPGKLLQTLTQIYKSAYASNERIVFFTSQDVPEQLWQHLYETMNFVDISNWFLLICGPEKLQRPLEDLCQKFSNDPVPFQFMAVDLAETKKIQNNFFVPETICAIPWSNLEIRTNGDITPCCMSTMISLGNIKTTSLEDAFNSDKMQRLRQELVNGNKPIECVNCWKVEDQGLTSIRIHNTKRLKKNLLLKYLDSPTLSMIDIKFNNTCNFKCRICSGESSSLFAQEENKHLKIPIKPSDKWEESTDFLNQIVQHLPTVENIDMYGGEPFLIKKFSKVLKMAVSTGQAKNIRLHYNSNGSIWPKEFLPYWSHFREVDIHFSIDDIGKRFELQRGGSWQEVENNIKNLQNLNLPNLKIRIMPTISVMNIYYLDELYKWAKDNNLDIFVSHVRSGKGFDLESLTGDAKKIILDKYQNHPWTEIQKILEIIRKIPDSDGRLFCDTVRWFDKVRQENFSESHNEIAQAMGYVYNRTL